MDARRVAFSGVGAGAGFAALGVAFVDLDFFAIVVLQFAGRPNAPGKGLAPIQLEMETGNFGCWVAPRSACDHSHGTIRPRKRCRPTGVLCVGMSSERYRGYAATCLQLARGAKDLDKLLFVHMADAWTRLAERAERQPTAPNERTGSCEQELVAGSRAKLCSPPPGPRSPDSDG